MIDHSYKGNILKKKIITSEKDNMVKFRNNHPFFNQDVIYYTDYKLGKVEVFYNNNSYSLIGYKEQNKNYVKIKNSNRKIKINYSIKNRLFLLGYDNRFIKINDKKNINLTIKNIIRKRADNLKKIIKKIQLYIYRVKHKQIDSNELVEYNDNIITKKYMNKLNKMKIKNEYINIFTNSDILLNNLYLNTKIDKQLVNFNVNNEYISHMDISLIDRNGNLLLFYIIQELTKLINLNKNSYIKNSVVWFIIDIINNLYNKFSEENINYNRQLKRFKYIAESKGFIYDMEKQGHSRVTDVTGFYGEYIDPNDIISEEELERREDINEEMNALDIDTRDEDYDILNINRVI